ncbi:unnamed protein product [Linum tenue]|uniref:Integral membrane bound transporter domain-containing protein n=1 Tax=Linum tenue TaxID=586396 RepID=A0AAV0PV15_9ROSI|nr:unnamed protein product [Linum tenue]
MLPNHAGSARARAVWQRCLASAFRTALACTIVGCATLYGPEAFKRQVAFPAFSYVTVILIVTDATLGDALRGCWLALYATVQTVCPAVVTFWMVGPGRFSGATISLAVAVNAFVVAVPEGTHVVAKRIALGQIVIIYVVGYINGAETQAVMHPLHVAASTAVGVVACVKKNCKLAAENASERLKLYVKASCADDKASASASLTRAKALASDAPKFLQKIRLHQESMRWETFPLILLRQSPPPSPVPKLQEVEMLLRGMEMGLVADTTTNSSSSMFTDGESKQSLLQLQEHITRAIKQVARTNSFHSDSSPTVPESNADDVTSSLEKITRTIPTSPADLPSFFFCQCIKHLVCISSPEAKSVAVEQPKEGSSTPPSKGNGFLLNAWKSVSFGSKNRVLPAVKCSVSLGMAVLFGLMYSKENGYWSGLPVAISLAATVREATFTVANVKAQGTVLGTVYGVVGCFVFERFLPVRFMSLLPWFVITSFLRRNRMYGQAGGISAVIGAILILGRKNFGPPSEFAIARIIETFIGLSCSIFVDLLLHPTRAASLAKLSLSESFAALGSAVDLLSLRGDASTALLESHKRLKSEVEELRKLVGEAELEPNFWFLPFPSACYGKLLVSLSNMADLLLFSAKLGVGFVESESLRLGDSDVDLKFFKDAMSPFVKCFEEVTKLKCSIAMLDEDLKRKNEEIGCDLESGKLPNQNAFKVMDASRENETRNIVDCYLGHVKEIVEKFNNGRELAMFGLGVIGFSISGLIREAREVERCVTELVQLENPSCQVNLFEIYCKINASQKLN